MSVGTRMLGIAFAALVACSAGGQTRRAADYDRLLLPFHTAVPSGGGSWFVQWWVRNDGADPVDVFPLAYECGLPPPEPGVSIASYPAVPPRRTLACLAGDALPSVPVPPFIPIRNSTGAFLFVERNRQELSVAGSITWFSPAGAGEPAHLNAVPAASFQGGTASILPVSLEANTRYAIRVYALPETVDATSVTVNIFDLQPRPVFSADERFIATFTSDFRFQAPALPPCRGTCDVPEVELAPAIVEFLNFPLPELQGSAATPLRVEIAPSSPNVRWWAVVSATDNDTQRVRLFQP
ncbi:MAG TPA: hypothetical protein VFT12_04270 [Thermoanaerobaculia bacterium]|nr:hypothetical protein [Thermoanaerobaculia bacterium]